MFGRKEPSPEELAARELERLQSQSDQVSDASEKITGLLENLAYESFHPWHAPDATLITLGGCAIAYSNDRTAEILRDNATYVQDDKLVLAADASEFAIGLTESAAEVFDLISELMPSQQDSLFDDETLESMAAENRLPCWPLLRNYRPQNWQAETPPYVSNPFARGIVAATRELQAEANAYVRRLTDETKFLAPVPPEYREMSRFIGELLRRSEFRTAKAEYRLLDTPAEEIELTDPEVYATVHGGYIDAMTAYIGVLCPPSLGTDFLPRR
jgi:hypothetical protein